MNLDQLVQAIDEEIDRLQRARSLLTGHAVLLKPHGNGGVRPKRRTMSAEARANIARAQRARRAREKKV